MDGKFQWEYAQEDLLKTPKDKCPWCGVENVFRVLYGHAKISLEYFDQFNSPHDKPTEFAVANCRHCGYTVFFRTGLDQTMGMKVEVEGE